MTAKPWTFEPMEMDDKPDPTWPIYDPNEARIVAVFYTEEEARDYLKWRNKKQAKLKARRDGFRRAQAEIRTTW